MRDYFYASGDSNGIPLEELQVDAYQELLRVRIFYDWPTDDLMEASTTATGQFYTKANLICFIGTGMCPRLSKDAQNYVRAARAFQDHQVATKSRHHEARPRRKTSPAERSGEFRDDLKGLAHEVGHIITTQSADTLTDDDMVFEQIWNAGVLI